MQHIDILDSIHEDYTARNLPFIGLDRFGREIDYFAVRPTYNYGVDNAVGVATARALVSDLRDCRESAVLTWTLLAICEKFNCDYRGIVIGFAEEIGNALLGRGAKG